MVVKSELLLNCVVKQSENCGEVPEENSVKSLRIKLDVCYKVGQAPQKHSSFISISSSQVNL